jgi:ABC-type phosphate transport system ATPase subunit
MCERLSDVEKPAYSLALIVGILGSSSVGKSTLINATMSIDELCPMVRILFAVCGPSVLSPWTER